jgi:hypothetical protein
VKKLAICDKILSIAQSHQTWCPYTKCKREQILNSQANNLKHLSVQINRENASEQELNSQEIERLELWRCVCALIGPDAVRIVEFAKRIPSFKNINQNYQILLIKAHFFKVWLLRISCMLIGSDETLLPTDSAANRFLSFESGHCISQDQLEIVFGVSSPLYNLHFSFFICIFLINGCCFFISILERTSRQSDKV